MAVLRCTVLLVAVAQTLAVSVPARAEDFPLKEYEKHVRRYVASLENLAFDFTETESTLDGKTTYRDECSVISIRGHFRVKNVSRAKLEDGTKKSKTEWTVLRPDGYYEIVEKADRRFVLKLMQKEITTPLQVDAGTPLSTLIRPVSAKSYPIDSLVRGDLAQTHSLKVTDFERHPDSKGAAYRFRGIYEAKGGQIENEFELNDHWLVTRFGAKAGIRIERQITYTWLDDRMLPSRITLTVFQPRTEPITTTVEFRNYRIYDGSPKDFSLTQFDLPEPMGASPIYQGESRWYLWFIGIALVCLASSVYLWRRVKHRETNVDRSSSKSLERNGS